MHIHRPPPSHIHSLQIRFTDFHAAASVCTPSRAGLLTGRYGLRTGISGNFGPNSLYGMAREEITIADVLVDVGYQVQNRHVHTACVCKRFGKLALDNTLQ